MTPLSPAEAKRRLGRLGSLPDTAIDLAEAGLLLACLDHPARPLGSYRMLLAEMAEALAETGGPAESVLQRSAALASVLAGRFGLVGDDRDDDCLDGDETLAFRGWRRRWRRPPVLPPAAARKVAKPAFARPSGELPGRP